MNSSGELITVCIIPAMSMFPKLLRSMPGNAATAVGAGGWGVAVGSTVGAGTGVAVASVGLTFDTDSASRPPEQATTDNVIIVRASTNHILLLMDRF